MRKQPGTEASGLKIRRATTRDFARIRWAEIQPEKAVFVIAGKNGQGKSSLINALIGALGGQKLLPDVPVRKGAERAETIVEIGTEDTTEFTIRQTVTKDGRYRLEVRQKDGFVHPQGQSFLDAFYSKLTFDPLALKFAKKKDRVDMLNAALGVDFSGLDFQRKQAYDERTIVNREVTAIEAQLRSKTQWTDVPASPVSVAGLSSELESAIAANQELESSRGVILAKENAVERLLADATRYTTEADELRRKADELEAKAKKALEDVDAVKAEIAAKKDELASATAIDVEAIRSKIRDASSTNEKVAENKAIGELQRRLKSAKKRSDDLSVSIGRIDQEKEATLRKAKFPVPGITITEEDILVNGLPFDQASDAEQLRISFNVAFLLRSGLQVFFSKEGGRFDDESLAVLSEEAERAKVQVLLELPTRTPADEQFASIIIEDGLIRGAGDAPDEESFLDGSNDEA